MIFRHGEFKNCHSIGYHKEDFTFISSLKACAKKKDLHGGSRLHAHIVKKGLLAKSPYLASTLISMYSRCGMVAKAQQVFEEVSSRDTILWNALIAGYSQEGQSHAAFSCFEQMQSEGLFPDVVTFTCILKACGNTGAIEKGKQIHGEIVNKGQLENDIVLGTVLVDMYVKCDLMAEARQVLEEQSVRDVVSWSILISGYAKKGQGNEALYCFEKMQKEGLDPDVVTFTCILKACASIGALEQGEHIHNEVLSRHLLEKDIVLGTAVVDMYAKCGMIEKARQSLLNLPVRDVVSWSALIAGYTQQRQCEEALNCFDQMQNEGISPDAITFISILKACGSTKAIHKGKQIHDEIVRRGMLGENTVLGNALVDMYAKCGMLVKAEHVLMELPLHDVVSWNVLISGYAQCGQCYKALDIFERMQSESLLPDAITVVCILRACGSRGAIERGKQIHGCWGFHEEDIVFGNALVDMYAKCGVLAKAQQVIEELPVRNVVSWNALISGHAQGGQGHEALNCLKYMQSDGLSPDEVTFQCVLRACGRNGLVNDAEMLFGDMSLKYGIVPSIEHHSCVLVVLGCAGYFDEVLSVTKVMPFSDHPIVWLAVLNACRKWGNVKLAKFAFNQIVEFNHNCAAAHVLISDIFAAAGMKEEVKKIESMKLKHE